MNWTELKAYFSEENVMALFAKYESFGPLPGILMTFIESFFPPLPLVAIVAGNAAAYGLWLGFLYSWIGVALGSITVFMICRRLGQHRFLHFLTRHPKVNEAMNWMNRHGFTAIFLFSCFPFTPSSLVNVVAGLSSIPVSHFVAAILIGKAIMIFAVSFIGHDLMSFIENPWKLALVGLAIFALWFVSKRIEARLTQIKHR
ncbi:TVP38/TMEM64 family protein [Aneurinibacillus sp. BA2021]|nr:TVP38/TMEM64 family protein [Aneurinibacillus sp. BA2021]